GADQYVEFGRQRGMQVHGHVMVWHQQTPAWVFQNADGSQVDAQTLWQRLEDHMRTLAERYGDDIAYWDIVNEAFTDSGELRASPWLDILGDDYIAHVFELADTLLPNTGLVYNDYSLFLPNKRDAVVDLVLDLRSRGIRIDAVGMQGHYGLSRPRTDELESALRAYGDAGVRVLITELDLDVLPSS